VSRRVRHILSLSGGKDSTALAIYMRDRVPEIEYVFCDTGDELPETYEYLGRLEAFLGRPIVRLNPDRPFSHYLDIYRGVLPDARTRWCTRMLKIKPFERYIGDDAVINYIGIRADEDRIGYISHRPNLTPRYPFKEEGLTKDDVTTLLASTGLGLPGYYRWRSRSGCYFCFFQQRIEWVGLLENHPDLFRRAAAYEKRDEGGDKRFTWCRAESLADLAAPERIAAIRLEHERRLQDQRRFRAHRALVDVLDDLADEDEPCLICRL
jgi:hypothetical protein